MYYNLQNRRYLGNKFKLLVFIEEVINKELGKFSSFCDLFAGTGVVGNHFNKSKISIISNDILKSNYVSLFTFLSSRKEDLNDVPKKIEHLNSLEWNGVKNYVSENFGSKYFDLKNAGLIGVIREEINKISKNNAEKTILLSSLVYAADKVANTCGHYAAFRKNTLEYPKIKLLIPEVNCQNNKENKIFADDANVLVRKIKSDVVYIDPPYNSRQYFNSYHVLENIVAWQKPELEGVTKLIKDRSQYSSDYCTGKAEYVFRDLIENIDAKLIVVSYNNTGEKLDSRSNSKLSDEQILKIMSTRGKVKIYEKEYKPFSTGKTGFLKNHTERLFVCKLSG